MSANKKGTLARSVAAVQKLILREMRGSTCDEGKTAMKKQNYIYIYNIRCQNSYAISVRCAGETHRDFGQRGLAAGGV